MKKKIALLLPAFFLALSLGACNSSKKTTTNNTDDQTQQNQGSGDNTNQNQGSGDNNQGGDNQGGDNNQSSLPNDGSVADPIATGASMQVGSRYYALAEYAETVGSPVASWMKDGFVAEAGEAVAFYVNGTKLDVFSDGDSDGNNITEAHPMTEAVQEVHIKTGGTMAVYLKQWESAYTFWITTPASGGSQQGGEGGSQQQTGAHGPEGSELVSWYIVGAGSLWETEWSVEGGVQLYSNPASETDKGCILSITFAENDLFKVTDGTNWYGYDKVNQYASDANKGKTNFEGADDGMGGKNIKCKVAGTYNIYVNASGEFWIEAAA